MDIQASPEPSPSTYSAPGRRGGHLKRLSLSVAQRDFSGESSTFGSLFSPERSQSSSPSSSRSNTPAARTDATVSSPLNRSLGSSRRQRPLSLYSNSSSVLDGLNGSPSPAIKNLPTCEEALEHDGPAQEATFTPTSSTRASPGLPLTPLSAGRSELNSSVGRRSILGRSAHARRQSSISYARSPSAVSPINGSSGPSTPRSSISTPRDTPGHLGLSSVASSGAEPNDQPAQTPARLDYFGAAKPAAIKTSGHIAEERDSESPKTSPYNELNVGIGAKSADLLTFIAKKERKCMDLREELKRNEEELATLKKKWEAIIQREMMSAAAAADSSITPARSESSSPQQSTQTPSSAGGLFSSITASLSASTSSSNSSATTASPSPSSRPSSASPANRRLLTSRHSISVSPTASRSSNSESYFGGANLSLQESPTERIAATSPGGSSQANYDVSKVAKSWLGGVMKHASSVLETLAPPPSATSPNDLGTVREEEEPEESDEENTDSRHSHNAEDRRRISTATEATLSSTTSSNSPSSSFDENEEDGRFSSTATSRSSSISSMDSRDESLHLSKSEESVGTSTDTSKQNKQGGDDITPVSTPLLPDTTPRAGKSPNTATEVDDLWGLDGFEDTSARENREKLEQARIDEVHTSPPKNRTAVEVTKPNHGRRRSTAFELGGAWGSMMGKKWSEVANSETFKTSKRATMNFVDTFEKTLGDALFEAPDAKKTSPESSQGYMTYLNGEYIPSSVTESPSPSERERSLPSGIGSAGAWSTLLGRSKTTPKSKNEEWTAQSPHGDLGETSMSPSSASARSPGGTRKARIALNDNPLEEDDESFDSFNELSTSPVQSLNSRVNSTKPVNPRLAVAPRTKHSKRMSLPSNLLVGEPRRPATSAFGLGLENVSEEDKAETEDAWGW